MMKLINKIATLMLAVMFLACGENKKQEEEKIKIGDYPQTESRESFEDSSASDTGRTATDSVSETGVMEVVITGNDQMKFNKKEIRVKAGQTVRLILKHEGKLKESVMGHNFVLLKKGTDLDAFAQEAAGAKANDYIPEGTDKVIANTEVIGGGQETRIEFKAPEKGTYDFICSFPGHYLQMRGKFIVE